jgi:hypothetical protein
MPSLRFLKSKGWDQMTPPLAIVSAPHWKRFAA